MTSGRHGEIAIWRGAAGAIGMIVPERVIATPGGGITMTAGARMGRRRGIGVGRRVISIREDADMRMTAVIAVMIAITERETETEIATLAGTGIGTAKETATGATDLATTTATVRGTPRRILQADIAIAIETATVTATHIGDEGMTTGERYFRVDLRV